MPAFRVWAVDDGDRPVNPNIVAADEEAAAIEFVERNHADLDYCAECEVRVDDEAGHKFCMTVEARQDVAFHVVGHD